MTLLAFGNGSPDVFSAISAVQNMKNDDVGLVFGALLGTSRDVVLALVLFEVRDVVLVFGTLLGTSRNVVLAFGTLLGTWACDWFCVISRRCYS